MKVNGKHYTFIVGVDTGVNTGVCVWNRKEKYIRYMETLTIHRAMEEVKSFAAYYNAQGVLIRVEDARKRTWFGNTGKERLKGAGSVERDAKIWEDFLTDLNVDFEMVHPKNNKTKLTSAAFNKITGWTGSTNQHARDACMLIFGF